MGMQALYYAPKKENIDTAVIGRRDGRIRVLAHARTVGAVFRQLFSVHGHALRGPDAMDHWHRITVRGA